MSQPHPVAFATLTLAPAIDCTVMLAQPLSPGHVHLATRETSRPGGKGINVAKVLATRGCTVAAGGLLGQDNVAVFERMLATLDIRDRFMRVPGETRTNMMIIDGRHEFKINRPAFPTLAYEEAFVRGAVVQLVANAEVVILSGSQPGTFPVETFARIVRTLKAMGRTVVVDTSGEALQVSVRAKPDIIKPNRHECELLMGYELSTPDRFLQACAELLQNHQVVIISDGHEGAWFAQDDMALHATAPEVQVVDTTAAGDMLLGEFCIGYFPDCKLTPQLVARAVAMGAAAVEQPSSDCPPTARVDELSRLSIVTEHKLPSV